MILADEEIRSALADARLVVVPEVDPQNIRPAGVRLHLQSHLLVPIPSCAEVDVDDLETMTYSDVEMDEAGYGLRTHEFVLGATREAISTSRNLICMLDGRSSLARVGLMVHCSSSIVDNVHGTPRSVVLEIVNLGPRTVRLRPGVAIAMLVLIETAGLITQNSSDQYAYQLGPTSPKPGVRRGRGEC